MAVIAALVPAIEPPIAEFYLPLLIEQLNAESDEAVQWHLSQTIGALQLAPLIQAMKGLHHHRVTLPGAPAVIFTMEPGGMGLALGDVRTSHFGMQFRWRPILNPDTGRVSKLDVWWNGNDISDIPNQMRLSFFSQLKDVCMDVSLPPGLIAEGRVRNAGEWAEFPMWVNEHKPSPALPLGSSSEGQAFIQGSWPALILRSIGFGPLKIESDGRFTAPSISPLERERPIEESAIAPQSKMGHPRGCGGAVRRAGSKPIDTPQFSML